MDKAEQPFSDDYLQDVEPTKGAPARGYVPSMVVDQKDNQTTTGHSVQASQLDVSTEATGNKRVYGTGMFFNFKNEPSRGKN